MVNSHEHRDTEEVKEPPPVPDGESRKEKDRSTGLSGDVQDGRYGAPAPVILTEVVVVTDVRHFISMTLLELKAALAGKRWQSGHWSVRELVDRLEQCGVCVEIESQAARASNG